MDIHNNEPGFDAPAHRRVEKVVGCNTSVYVKPRNMPHYEGIKRLAAKDERSFSEVLNDSLKQVYFQQRTRTTVSGAAYLAIANGDVSRLMIIRHGDGTRELVVSDGQASPDSMDCPDRTFAGMSCDYAYRFGSECLEKAVEPEDLPQELSQASIDEIEKDQQTVLDEEILADEQAYWEEMGL